MFILTQRNILLQMFVKDVFARKVDLSVPLCRVTTVHKDGLAEDAVPTVVWMIPVDHCFVHSIHRATWIRKSHPP
jgi:hypothetical protein